MYNNSSLGCVFLLFIAGSVLIIIGFFTPWDKYWYHNLFWGLIGIGCFYLAYRLLRQEFRGK